MLRTIILTYFQACWETNCTFVFNDMNLSQISSTDVLWIIEEIYFYPETFFASFRVHCDLARNLLYSTKWFIKDGQFLNLFGILVIFNNNFTFFWFTTVIFLWWYNVFESMYESLSISKVIWKEVTNYLVK